MNHYKKVNSLKSQKYNAVHSKSCNAASRVSSSDKHINMATGKRVKKSKAPPEAPCNGQGSVVPRLLEGSGARNALVMCPASLQGKLLMGVTSLAQGRHICFWNTEPFPLCLVHNFGYASISSKLMAPGSNHGSLSGSDYQLLGSNWSHQRTGTSYRLPHKRSGQFEQKSLFISTIHNSKQKCFWSARL